jgi:uncharacterized protein (TIGR02246 family)
MKLLLTIALLTMVATSALSADTNKASDKSDEAITKTTNGFFGAWNKHDVKTMVTFWADDATLINPEGRMAQGKAEIEKLLTDEQGTIFRASTANVVEMKVTRWLGSGMAFCDGETTVDGAQGPDGSALPQLKMHLAVILERKGATWMFAEARPYAFVQPPPQPVKAN